MQLLLQVTMGEIDDKYQENLEAIESDFFEKFKKGKKREKVIQEYHADLEKIRKQYEKEYEKKIRADRILANKKKKDNERQEDYKHFEVGHLDFEISKKEIFFSKIKLKIFKIDRFLKGNISQKIPTKILYLDYKLWIILKRFWRGIIEVKDNFIAITKKEFFALIKGISYIYKKVVEVSLKFFKMVVSLFSLLKRKKKPTEEKTENKEKSQDSEKEEKTDVSQT